MLLKKRRKTRSFKSNTGKIHKRKRFVNPYFQKRKKKKFRKLIRELSWRLKFIFFGLLIIIILTIWIILFSPLFRIKAVNVLISDKPGDNIPNELKIDKGDITALVWNQTNSKIAYLIPQTNLFLFSKQKLEDNIKKRYSYDTIKILKILPRTLSIDLNEVNYAIIWLENEKFYYVNMSGNIITEANPIEITQKLYPLIENQSRIKITGDAINPDVDLTYIISLFKQSQESLSNYQLDRFIIDDEVNTIKLKIADGPAIYFNTAADINQQLRKLIVVINEKLNDDFMRKNYVDLRYGDRIYYR